MSEAHPPTLAAMALKFAPGGAERRAFQLRIFNIILKTDHVFRIDG
jgi:hypothetical protein